MSFLFLLVSGVIFYYYLIDNVSFSPRNLVRVDTGYTVFLYFFSVINIANGVSLIFYYIREYAKRGHILIGKFVPLLRFVSISLIWIIGFFLLLSDLHIDTSRLLTGASIGGAIFALASKDIVSNLIGSLTIILGKLFDIGDEIFVKEKWVRVEGRVEEITLNYTKILSYDGTISFVPNRYITNEAVDNRSMRRFFLYTYRIPFRRLDETDERVTEAIRSIEKYLRTYNPIDLKVSMIEPNVNDINYEVLITLAEEDRQFEEKLRDFLSSYLFRGKKEEE